MAASWRVNFGHLTNVLGTNYNAPPTAIATEIGEIAINSIQYY